MKNYYELDASELMEIDGGGTTITGTISFNGKDSNGNTYTGSVNITYTPDPKPTSSC